MKANTCAFVKVVNGITEMPEGCLSGGDEFADALGAVRRQIVREEWEVTEGTLEDNEDLMLGYCHSNAILTCRELASRGYDPRLVWGALNYGSPCQDPKSVVEVEKNGGVHFWTEIDRDRETVILDPAQETETATGSSLITTELPDEYVRLPDGQFVFHEDISPDHLRNVDGYDTLVNKGYLISDWD